MKPECVAITATSEAELKAKAVALSLQHPGKAIVIHASLGAIRAYIYPSVGKIPVDTAATRQMLSTYGAIAFVDGALVAPTKGWQRQQILTDKRTHE